jgi:hypothetical protein
MRTALGVVAAMGLLAACGSGTAGTSTSTGSTTTGGTSGTTGSTTHGNSTSSSSGTTGSVVPAPGTVDNVDNDFKSVEPNDTPAQATPLGIALGPDISTWVSGDTIGGTDSSDYFVFESGPMAGQFTLGQSGLCYTAGITQLSASLWKVSGGMQVLPPVKTWTSTTMCLTSAPGDAPIEASTTYLLGVTATGASGTYSA